MRYLPLTDADRSAMLKKTGASSIDDLFVDVPEEARLSGPIEGLPMHASEMAVEKHMRRLSKKNLAAADAPCCAGIATIESDRFTDRNNHSSSVHSSVLSFLNTHKII